MVDSERISKNGVRGGRWVFKDRSAESETGVRSVDVDEEVLVGIGEVAKPVVRSQEEGPVHCGTGQVVVDSS